MKTAMLALACAGAVAAEIPSPIAARCTPGLTPAPGSLKGHTALVVSTSHDRLGPSNCTTCKKTGVYSEELTAPYLLFRDAGINVTIATIAGGNVPFDPSYNFSILEPSWDRRFFADPLAYKASHNCPSVAEVDFLDYDIVFMAGGWGAAWDLGTSSALAAGVTKAYAAGKLVGSVCHGALGFIHAEKPDGVNMCKGTNMTGVTDRQIEFLQIAKLTPMHPEDELKKAGANYMCKHGLFGDLFENDIVLDGRIVTGQNQMGACMVPQHLMHMLPKKL